VKKNYWERLQQQRITRRRLLGGAAVTAAGAAAFGLAGCDDEGGGEPSGGTPGTAQAEGTPIPGGILHSQQAVAYPNFSPFGALAALTQGLFVGFTFYDHLWYVPTDTGTTEPFLASEIEQVDALQVNVTMGDATFHDKPPINGRDVRSTDLKASVERFREDPPLGFSWLHEIFDRIETSSDRELTYFQNRPWAWFFTSSNAGSPISSSIIPEELLDGSSASDEILQNDPIGSGRWMLEGHSNFTNLQLRKFPNWREPGLPYLDGIDYLYITEDAQAIAAFRDQQIDSIAGLTSDELADLEADFSDEIATASDLSRAYRTLMLKYEEPFLDERVRQGINLGLNRQEIMDTLDLGDGQFAGPVPPSHQSYVLPDDDPDLQEWFRFDAAEGRAMLEAANFPMDEPIDLQYSNFGDAPQLAQIVHQQLTNLGLNVNLPPAEDLVTLWLPTTLQGGNFKMTCFTHLPYEDPSLPLAFYMGPGARKGAGNFMGYQDDDVDAAILAAAEELEEEARIEKTKEAQRVVIQKWGPMLNLYSAITFGARWNYLKGVVTGRGSYGAFNSRAWLDK
jgi:peptide/nickel transport system substrate-binding protein